MKKQSVALLFLLIAALAGCAGNHSPAPVNGIEKKDPVRELLEKTGFDRASVLVQDFFCQTAARFMMKSDREPDEETLKQARVIVSEISDPQKLSNAYYDQFKKELTHGEILAVIDWLDSPSGRKIVEQDLNALKWEELAERETFEQDIMNLQASPGRLRLIRKYLEIKNAAGRLLENDYQTALVDAEIRAAVNSLSYEKLAAKVRKDFDENKEKNKQACDRRAFVNALFFYRHVPDSDFMAYVNFLETDTGEKFDRASYEVDSALSLEFYRKIRFASLEQTAEKQEPLVFEEYNFTFTKPVGAWKTMDSGVVNNDAKLCLARTRPDVFFMIIPEIVGTGMHLDLKTLMEVSRVQLESNTTRCMVTEANACRYNGVGGIRYDASATTANMDFYYCFCLMIKGGIAYNLVAFGQAKFKDAVRAEAEALFNGFQLIDENKVAHSEQFEPYSAFSSPFFNYSIDLKDLGWIRWKDLEIINESAETGGFRGTHCFMIFPFHLSGEKPPAQAVLAALLDTMDISMDDKNISGYKEFVTEPAECFSMNYRREYDDGEYFYSLNALVTPENAWLVAVWNKSGWNDLNPVRGEIMKRFTAGGSKGTSFDPDQLPGQIRLAQAQMNYSLGLYLIDTSQFETALTYLQQAVSMDASNENHLAYACVCYSRLGRYSEGLDYLERHAGAHRGSLKLLSWKAWFYKKTRRFEESLAIYREIFEKGYRDEEDFIEYADILSELGQWDEAEAVFDRYVQPEWSMDVHLKQAYLLYDQGKYSESVGFLKKLQTGIPLNPDISVAIADNYTELGDYKGVIGIADALIEKNLYTAYALRMKGKAQYKLKWYHKAKASFEQSLEYEPENPDSQDYIQHISGLIGQGDNSAVKRPIEPVPIPLEVRELFKNAGAISSQETYGSSYIRKMTGIHFTVDGDQRVTTYRTIRLRDKSGVAEFSTIEIDFDPLSEDLYVNGLLVKDEQGNLVGEGKPEDFFITDKQMDSMKTHDKVLNIPIPQLKPGYTIELTSTVQYNNDDFVYYWGTLTSSRPVGFSCLFITGDTGVLAYKSNLLVREMNIEGGLLWWADNPPVYQWEPYQADYEAYLPVVRVSDSRKTWQQLGDAYLKEIGSRLELDYETRKLSGTLTKNTDTKESKIRALISHIQSEYTYKALEFGKRAVIPNSSGVTIRNRYGDCKDHAVLLYQLLRAASIPSSLVLVNAYNPVDEALPSLDQFDHMINYIPDGTEGWFVDTTSKNLDALRFVPMGLGEHKALILEPGNVRFQEIPAYASQSNRVGISSRVTMNEKGGANIIETVVFNGYVAASMRDYLTSVDKIDYTRWVHELYSKRTPSCSSFALDVGNMEARDHDLVFRVSYDVAGTTKADEPTGAFTLPPVWEDYYLSVQPLIKRKTDIRASYPLVVNKHVDVSPPAGYTLGLAQMKPMVDKTHYGSFSVNIAGKKTGVSIDFECISSKGFFPRDAYPDFKGFFDRVIKAGTPEMTLEKL